MFKKKKKKVKTVETKPMEQKFVAADLILKSMVDSICVIDKDGRIIRANKAYVKMHGYKSADEIIGKRIHKFVAEREIPKAMKRIQGDFRRGIGAKNFEFIALTKGKKEFPVSLNVTALRDGKRKLIGTIAVIRDITERKRVEEALREQKNRAQKYLDIAGVMLLIVAADETIVLINRRGCEILGYSEEEIIGKNWFNTFIAKPIRKETREIFRKLMAGKLKPVGYYENSVITKSGEDRLIAWRNTILKDEQGNIIGILSSAEDITKRKEVAEALMESEENYRMITETSVDGIYQIDNSGKFTFLNEAVLKMFRHKREEMLGKYFADFIAKTDLPKAMKLFERLISGENVQSEIVCKHKLGHEFPIYFSAAPIIKQGKIVSITGIMHDITERKQAEKTLSDAYQRLKETQEQLIQSGKMAAMGQLAAGVSHELNQPLTGIKGFAEAALMDLDKKGPIRREDLKKIIEQAERMDRIIKSVRYFAKKSDFRMRVLDINQPIEDSLMLLGQQLKVHNIRLKKSLAKNLPKIQGDLNQLQQVFLNLITNAKDAIVGLKPLKGGELIVKTSLSKDKNNIEIIFQDTGCGISRKNLEYIFNPFFTTKSPDGGIGLGLSIVYRIIESHKGRIKALSRKGKGTRLKITLPALRKVGRTKKKK